LDGGVMLAMMSAMLGAIFGPLWDLLAALSALVGGQ
jgi:hypothetical protein